MKKFTSEKLTWVEDSSGEFCFIKLEDGYIMDEQELHKLLDNAIKFASKNKQFIEFYNQEVFDKDIEKSTDNPFEVKI